MVKKIIIKSVVAKFQSIHLFKNTKLVCFFLMILRSFFNLILHEVHFAISQSKVPRFDLMSLTTGHYTSPQNRFLYSCATSDCTNMRQQVVQLYFIIKLCTGLPLIIAAHTFHVCMDLLLSGSDIILFFYFIFFIVSIFLYIVNFLYILLVDFFGLDFINEVIHHDLFSRFF